MLRIASPLAWTKNWFFAASHFCKPRVSICVCHMVYFASSQHIDEPRCIALYVAFMCVLQNLYESSASNSSCDNNQFIFAQIYKQWLFLSSAAHACSLYFAATYRLAMFHPTCKKSKMKHTPASHNKRVQKSKIKNTQTQKIDASHNDHIFYHAATAPCIMLLAAFFTWACSNQTRSFAATQQKIVFIIFKMLMFTLVRFVLCPIAISVIILLKVSARL